MTTLLQTKAFHRIPPANIQAIFHAPAAHARAAPARSSSSRATKAITSTSSCSGKCVVTRETPLNREGIKLAELGVGDTFGEEALIAEAKRNATVTMMTDGVLMRLNKQDFRELMNEPLLQWVNAEQGRKIIERGGRWLDVRLPSEHQNLSIEGSLNVPAVPHPPEALDLRPHQALRRVLRHRAAQLRGRLHPGRAGLRCLRAHRRHERRRPAAGARRGQSGETVSVACAGRHSAPARYMVWVALSPERAPAR